MNIIKTYKEWFDSINEGLIKTYDGKLSIDSLVDNLSLLNFDVSGEYKNNMIKLTIKNIRYLNNDRFLILMDHISSMMVNRFGWFYSSIQYKKINGGEFNIKYSEEHLLKIYKDIVDLEITFDSKFDEICDINFDKLYHLTIKEYQDSIDKIGLIPKTKSKLSNYTDRIYLCSDIKHCKLLITQMKIHYSEESDYYKYQVRNDKYNKNTKWIIYEIDNSNHDLVLYKDPRYEFGYYTLNNINKDRIKLIESES